MPQDQLAWARRLQGLVEQGIAMPIEDSGYGRSFHPQRELQKWVTQSEACLIQLLGPTSLQLQYFQAATDPSNEALIDGALGVLEGVRDDLAGGWLESLEGLVRGEVFTDFLEMADHLNEETFSAPAAALAGAVLEEHLRAIARTGSLKVARDNLGGLNDALLAANVYGKAEHDLVRSWTKYRNEVDHGALGEASQSKTAEMLRFVRRVLIQYPK